MSPYQAKSGRFSRPIGNAVQADIGDRHRLHRHMRGVTLPSVPISVSAAPISALLNGSTRLPSFDVPSGNSTSASPSQQPLADLVARLARLRAALRGRRTPSAAISRKRAEERPARDFAFRDEGHTRRAADRRECRNRTCGSPPSARRDPEPACRSRAHGCRTAGTESADSGCGNVLRRFRIESAAPTICHGITNADVTTETQKEWRRRAAICISSAAASWALGTP